jgi:tape measure domain-containing protein
MANTGVGDNYPITITADPSDAIANAKRTEDALARVPETKTTTLVLEDSQALAAAARMKALLDGIDREVKIHLSLDEDQKAFLKAGGAPLEGERGFVGPARAQAGNQFSVEELGGARVSQGAGAVNDQLERQASLFGQIRGPALEYSQNMQALQGLYQRGSISATEFNAKQQSLTETFQASSQGSSALQEALGGVAGQLLQVAAAYASVHAVADVVRETIELTDEYTNLQNRVRQVTGSEEELNSVTKQLIQVSDDTRTSVEDNAAVFQRSAAALGQLGYSTQVSIDLTKELDEIIAASGATTAQSSRAMIEFSEALGKGKLQGQELRSIMKEVPTLALEIQRGLGVSKEKFGELVGQGDITTEQIVKALRNVSDEVDQKFAKTVPTASSVLTVLHNDLVEFAGEVVGGTGPALLGLEEQLREVLHSLEPTAKSIVEFAKSVAAPAIVDVADFIRSDAEAFSHFAEVIAPIPHQLDLLEASLTPFKALEGVTKIQDELINSTEQLTEAVNAGFEANQRKHAAEANDFQVAQFYAQRQKLLDASRAQDAEHLIAVIERGGAVQRDQLDQFTEVEQGSAEAAKAHEKELDKLEARVHAGGKAQAEFNAYSEHLVELLARGRIGYTELAEAVDEYRQANIAALDPTESVLQDLQKQVDVLDAVGGSTEKQRFIEQELSKERQKGILVNDDLLDTLDKAGTILQRHVDANKAAKKAQEESAAAAKKHAQELSSLLDKITATAKAQHELARTQADLDQLVAQGKITTDQAAEAIKAWHAEYDAVLDPIGHVQAALRAEREDLELTDQQRERSVKVREFEQQVASKGVALSKEEHAQIVNLVDSYYDEKDVHQELVNELEAQNAVLDRASNAFVAHQAEVKKDAAAMRSAAEGYDAWEKKAAGSGDLLAATDLALKDLKAEVLDTSGVMKTLFTDSFEGINTGLADLVTKGKDSILGMVREGSIDFDAFGKYAQLTFDNLTQKILADMTDILIKLAEVKLLGALLGGGGGAAAAGSFGDLFHIKGFAGGGDMDVVGGRGGTDNNIALLRVSNDEHISVRTRGQMRAEEQLRGAGGAVFEPRIINYVDKASYVDALNTPAGHRTILNAQRLQPNVQRVFAR